MCTYVLFYLIDRKIVGMLDTFTICFLCEINTSTFIYFIVFIHILCFLLKLKLKLKVGDIDFCISFYYFNVKITKFIDMIDSRIFIFTISKIIQLSLCKIRSFTSYLLSEVSCKNCRFYIKY